MNRWEQGLIIPASFSHQQGLKARYSRSKLLQNIPMLDLPFYLARTQGEIAVSLTLLAITAIETITGLEAGAETKKRRLLIRNLDWFIYHAIRLWKRDKDPNWLVALKRCHQALAILTGRSPFGAGLITGGAGALLTAEQVRQLQLSLDWLQDFLNRKDIEVFKPLVQEERLKKIGAVWLAAQALEGIGAGKVLNEGQIKELDWSRVKHQVSGLVYDNKPCQTGPLARQKVNGNLESGYLIAACSEMKSLLPEASQLLSDLFGSQGDMGSQWPAEGEGEIQLFQETPAGPAGLALKLKQGKVAEVELYTPDRWYNPLFLAALGQGLLNEDDIFRLARDWGVPVGLMAGGRF